MSSTAGVVKEKEKEKEKEIDDEDLELDPWMKRFLSPNPHIENFRLQWEAAREKLKLGIWDKAEYDAFIEVKEKEKRRNVFLDICKTKRNDVKNLEDKKKIEKKIQDDMAEINKEVKGIQDELYFVRNRKKSSTSSTKVQDFKMNIRVTESKKELSNGLAEIKEKLKEIRAELAEINSIPREVLADLAVTDKEDKEFFLKSTEFKNIQTKIEDKLRNEQKAGKGGAQKEDDDDLQNIEEKLSRVFLCVLKKIFCE